MNALFKVFFCPKSMVSDPGVLTKKISFILMEMSSSETEGARILLEEHKTERIFFFELSSRIAFRVDALARSS